ncbi:CpaF family protein [Streptomyces aculeolatus]
MSGPPPNGHGPVPSGSLTALLKQGINGRVPAAPAAPPAAGPEEPGAVGQMPGALPVDSSVIQALQEAASEEVASADRDRLLSGEDRQQQARVVVRRLVSEWAARYAQGAQPLTREQEVAVRGAVFDAMFRAGPVQPFLDDDGIEDILLDGTRVLLEYFDRPRTEGPRIFHSHAELIAWINKMAAASGHGERQLSPARPMASFRLPDGSRVEASLLTSRPVVAIRRHRLATHTLKELQRLGTLSPAITQLMRACVEAKRNILVAGEMGAGKTSLLRALGRTIPASERVVTLETDRELYLDEPGEGPYALAMEARQSNGELDDSGRPIGEVSIANMFPSALRMNASRVIVGEVRSVEIVPMLQAMSAGGSGSMCTIHVRRTGNIAGGVLGRLMQLCTEAGLSEAAAWRLIAASVDVVVYIELVDETSLGGRKHRFVSHVFEVNDVGEGGRPDITTVLKPTAHDVRGVEPFPPTFLDDLVREGRFDANWLKPQHTAWPEPLHLLSRPAPAGQGQGGSS